MDTRRMPGTMEAVQWPSNDAFAAEVEIVELRHVERPIRGLIGKLAFALAIGVLAGLVVTAGLPPRSPIAFDTPLPNLLAPVTAP